MRNEPVFCQLTEKLRHSTVPFFRRPFGSRREFFRLLGAGVGASFLGTPAPGQVVKSQSVDLKGTAKNVIFILLAGAPSHVDTFDLKFTDRVTPAGFRPEAINGLLFNTGVFPKIASQLDKIAIMRSVRAWAVQHTLSQTWVEIGRSPAAVLGDVAPNIGSIVAAEKQSQRKPGDTLPTFLALNATNATGSGFLPASFEPFRVTPNANGLANTTHPDGEQRFGDKLKVLEALDGGLRTSSPYGLNMQEYGHFYESARGLMYNPVVSRAFGYSADESERYGSTGFGNALLIARKVLEANQGTRYIQVTLGGWDMHSNIYAQQGAGLFSLGATLDNGYGALLADLKGNGLLDETLVVMMGEFGRTPGTLNNQGGRDHYAQQFCTMAGGGVKGGRAIGTTDEIGAHTVESGWSADRNIRMEDIEATIYSALGINWTNIRYDDPVGRGFEYVPNSKEGVYRPIEELWR